ncbi:enolase C-terminal domain-like protein [Brachybacterium sp. AOP42-C2-15]|uniref:enolase C-terminal domain-like protein n=1 Tax=Brachybacterium sp. AOP42-C2-15 TaxID=3457670 RepID=UPI004034E89A
MTAAPRDGRPSDIQVREALVSFQDVALEPPFVISGRPLTHVSAVTVQMSAVTKDGRIVDGTGAGMLSAPWAWPSSTLDLAGRDQVMRELVRDLAARLNEAAGFGDPFTLWRPLYNALDDVLEEAAPRANGERIPRLAGLLALGPVDNALHDAWSRAAGRPLREMYTSEYLREDLGRYGAHGVGLHPSDTLTSPRGTLPIQHALGVGDPLVPGEQAGGERSLEEWIRAEGVHHLKLKLAGDPVADQERLRDVHRIASRQRADIRLSLDPNEAYTLPRLAALFDDLERHDPEVLSAIDYLEQPIPRDEHADPVLLRRLAARVPVLLDEGYTRLSQLETLQEQGWSGVVIKAVKGQSHAMITQAIARRAGMKLAIQDLTAVDLALEHSLGLASVLPVSWPAVEYNSRQYAAAANGELAARRPESVAVRDGQVTWHPGGLGLFGD